MLSYATKFLKYYWTLSFRDDKKNESKALNCDDLDVCMILVDKDLQNENQILNDIAASLTAIKDKILHQGNNNNNNNTTIFIQVTRFSLKAAITLGPVKMTVEIEKEMKC